MTVKKVYAYWIYSVLVDPGKLELNDKYECPVKPNTIWLTEERQSFIDHEVNFTDGPLNIIAGLSFIGEGASTDGKVNFSDGIGRQLALLTAGADYEKVIIEQIHRFSSSAQELVEEVLSRKWSTDSTGDAIRAIEALEHEFIG
jgi:hypothetical protein